MMWQPDQVTSAGIVARIARAPLVRKSCAKGQVASLTSVRSFEATRKRVGISNQHITHTTVPSLPLGHRRGRGRGGRGGRGGGRGARPRRPLRNRPSWRSRRRRTTKQRHNATRHHCALHGGRPGWSVLVTLLPAARCSHRLRGTLLFPGTFVIFVRSLSWQVVGRKMSSDNGANKMEFTHLLAARQFQQLALYKTRSTHTHRPHTQTHTQTVHVR